MTARPRFMTALLATLCLTAPALAGVFQHETNIVGRMGNHPNTVHFSGATDIEVDFAPAADGGDNPLYQGQTLQGENPLFDSAADPGTPGSVESISFQIDHLALSPAATADGLVHRAIAARNFLVTTSTGAYQSAPGAFLLFGNDGPPVLRGHTGPIRWMAPESLRLQPVGTPAGENDWIEIAAFASVTVNYAPEPTSAALTAIAATVLLRRRR